MFSSLTEGFNWIESFTNLEKEPNKQKRFYRLERMTALLVLFESPHRRFKSIHIAGSKGKGSTAVLISSALKENGFKTGLYTSPHIQTYRERIRINGEILEDSVYLSQINHIYKTLQEKSENHLPGGDNPTTFELLTLLGFLVFAEQKCDWVVVETGLGGRLDATNTVLPEIGVITPIELEHTKWLGDTLEKVAAEKGGIIKDHVPLVIAPQKGEVFDVLSAIAQEKNALFIESDKKFRVSRCSIDLWGTRGSLKSLETGRSYEVKLKLIGDIQLQNAITALTALNQLFPEKDPAHWINGFSNAVLPGRMQVLIDKPVIITDGAHTPNSFKIAVKSFNKLINKSEQSILLFGCGDDKDADNMAKEAASFSNIVITTPGFFKKMDPQLTANIFKKRYDNVTLIRDPKEAFKKIRSDFPDTPVLVCGSFFLSGEIVDLMEKGGRKR